MITKPVTYKEHSFRILDSIQYAKSGHVLRAIEAEADILEKQKADIEARLKFLHQERAKAIKYRLTH